MTDDVLAPLADLTSLTTLHIGWSDRFSGDGLRHLSGLRNLKTLDLGSLTIDDEALVHLASLTHLEELRMHYTRLVGPGLRHLAGLTKLRKLDLGGNDLIDEAMPHLARLHTLEWLDISHAKITDDGLRQLAPIRNIAYLGLNGVKVSPEAIRDIRPTRPI